MDLAVNAGDTSQRIDVAIQAGQKVDSLPGFLQFVKVVATDEVVLGAIRALALSKS